MSRFLIVDDEPNVLNGLKRMLRDMRREWDVAYLGSGQEALALLAREHFDIIVSDMRMPGMDGAEFLERVRAQYPHMVRIVLSGHSDQSMLIKSAKPAHQFLSKPCDAETLKSTLARAVLLSQFMADKALVGMIGLLESLPALPEALGSLMDELNNENVSLKRVGQLVSTDMGLSATILKLVNSSFFGMRRQVNSPAEAVGLLGLDVIRGLIATSHMFSEFNTEKVRGFSFPCLWEHSLRVAGLARRLCQTKEWGKQVADIAFLGGLLHDLGKLVLAAVDGEKYNLTLEMVRQTNKQLWDMEKLSIGTTHAEAGAYLMGLWGLPELAVQAIAFHHHPRGIPQEDPRALAAVHLANCLEHALCIIHPGYARRQPDEDFLRSVGLDPNPETWRGQLAQVLEVDVSMCLGDRPAAG